METDVPVITASSFSLFAFPPFVEKAVETVTASRSEDLTFESILLFVTLILDDFLGRFSGDSCAVAAEKVFMSDTVTILSDIICGVCNDAVAVWG